jgi:preprotein translocase subunit SecD
MDTERSDTKDVYKKKGNRMSSKFKQIFTNWRVIMLVVFLIFSIWFIRPNFQNEGAAVRFVVKNSTAALGGMHGPLETDRPMMYEIITDVNGNKIRSSEDFNKIVENLETGDIVRIKSKSMFSYNKNNERTSTTFKTEKSYSLKVMPKYETITLNETETVIVEETIPTEMIINGTSVKGNKTINVTKEVPKVIKNIIGKEDLGIKVQDAPMTNLIKGLDLQGGTRVMLKPEGNVSDADLEDIISGLKERLDVYGLANIPVVATKDLLGNQYISVEIAGINEEEIKDLLAKQGKFEAKIGNDTVFIGGRDITYVCRSADCSYAVDPRKPCGMIADGSYQCTFGFSITLSQDAAQRQASASDKLTVLSENGYEYLSEPLSLYLDDELVDELRISADLKGKAETSIAISGPGYGINVQEAQQNSAKAMKRLQTILKTGSLPVKLEIVKVDTVSPVLGSSFIKNALIVGLAAMIAVSLVIFIRYKELKITVPIILIMSSEVIMLLGFAALAGWNLDLAAIAGIIVAVGTGANDLIIIADESIGQVAANIMNWKEKFKRAFYIITAAYLTTLFAMIPLWSAGAGLLRGFALITIVGISLGVFVARPAYGAVVEILLKD